ncbi:unnamed protein product [Vitrella brassicaformis CCMP3155]|uniref:Uncharacterized protein n=1 Tax=Vitrella brassicaformis (strain CCMP3155) TaxID=1169540 RepID=A0A0G4GSA5_VITBC|nr:unnamed protein product [Vitrella brassicaformis CCMP3155]|eukprot:CEM33508.1 unnamed protein product [Vitrella brassicaformis CCMP3155]
MPFERNQWESWGGSGGGPEGGGGPPPFGGGPLPPESPSPAPPSPGSPGGGPGGGGGRIRLHLEHRGRLVGLHAFLYRDLSPELGAAAVRAAKHHLHHPRLAPSYHGHLRACLGCLEPG